MSAVASGAAHAPASGVRHIVSVWDPTRGRVDTMDATLTHLLALARARASLHEGEDDVRVWWGKMRSPNRQQPLAHLGDVLALDAAIRGGDPATSEAATGDAETRALAEVHLYLTDYRSLYVAHVGEITADDPRDYDDEAPHVPPAVYPHDVACDCWFQLFDVRRLVLDDTGAVVEELKKLRNVRYHGRPVSLYGGMVELPLLVTRPDEARWFDAATRERLTDGKLWVEFDAELSGVGATTASLRDDVLGEATWAALDPAARTFVANAEKLWRDHRADAAFDFSPVVVNLAKAYEVQLAVLLGAVRGRVPERDWLVNVDGRGVHLLDGAPGLGAVGRGLEVGPLRAVVQRLFEHGAWATASLPSILRELAEARNEAAHQGRVGRETARRLRDLHLGVGCQGWLVDLARTRPR